MLVSAFRNFQSPERDIPSAENIEPAYRTDVKMNHFSLFFYKKSIPAKLFMINLLIFIVFGIIAVSVSGSFQYIKNEMTKIFSAQLHQVAENAEIGRELARMLSETNLLVSTFFGKEEYLKTGTDHLIGQTDSLIKKNGDPKLKKSLTRFKEKVHRSLEQCAAVNRVWREIERIDRDINRTLDDLGDTVSGKIVDLTMDGRDSSIMEQMSFIVSGYRETLPQITIQFNRLGLAYFESPAKADDHPILELLRDLQLRLRTLTASEPDIAAYGKRLTDQVQKYNEMVLQFHMAVGELRTRLDEMNQEKENLLALMEKLVTHIAEAAEEGIAVLDKRISKGITAGILAAFLMTLTMFIFVFLLGRSVTLSLNRVIRGIKNASREIAGASVQVLSASQQLAAGTSNQAASLESTSLSLEEMDGAIRQNADNAAHADRIVKGSAEDIHAANISVSELTLSMADISDASKEIRKIIKTIDEIAFRTNLLSLNAAVEAARAGEAGSGFAVVAEEVRSLAMQSAEASQGTAKLIENTVKKVEDGVNIVSMVSETFRKIEANSREVIQLVSNVAVSSNQQARGIGHISGAVSEMDKVVQENAVRGKELAGASEKMKSRASEMKGFIQSLAALTGSTGH
jgi:methyl-accepting chemotaxis protein